MGKRYIIKNPNYNPIWSVDKETDNWICDIRLEFNTPFELEMMIQTLYANLKIDAEKYYLDKKKG